MVAALLQAAAQAVLAGDVDAARVAHEAVGKLLDLGLEPRAEVLQLVRAGGGS